MKKNICVVLTAAFIIALSGNYAAGWEYRAAVSANYNQTAVSNNWQGSESNSKSWMIKTNLQAEKDAAAKNWLNTVKTEYGRTSISDEPERVSADLIDMESVYTRKFNLYLNPYAAFSVDSQFEEFFNPTVLGQSAGLGWNIIKNESQNLNTRLGGALRQKLQEGLKPEHETGAESVTNYSIKIHDETKFTSELNIFTPFDGSVDMRWDSGLYVKLRKYLTANIGYLALYSPDASSFPDDMQSRLTMGLGFSYNLM